MTDTVLTPRHELWKSIQDRGGALISTTGGLGVFVSPERNMAGCPPGWVFVDLDTADFHVFDMAMEAAKRGRLDWPLKEDGSRPR